MDRVLNFDYTEQELQEWQRNRGRKIDEKEIRTQCRNRLSNAQGQHFEREILAGCRRYKDLGLAVIDKTPEPFRVTKRVRTAFSQAALQPLLPRTFRGRLQAAAPSSLKPSMPQRTP